MATEFKLPELGEGVDSADVSRIFVSEGDEIQADQNIMELETEKAVADLPCPHAGKVTKIHVSEGDTIKVGQTLLTIEEVEAEDSKEESPPRDDAVEEDSASAEDDETKAEKQKKEETSKDEQAEETRGADADDMEEAESANEKAEDAAVVADEEAKDKPQQRNDEKRKPAQEKEPSQKPSQATRDDNEKPLPAGPATRRLARKLEVDLAELEPTDGGRIKQEDIVRAYVESGKASSLAREELPDFEKLGPVERQPLNKIARTAAKRLTDSWRIIPHVTQHGSADITGLEAARREFVADADESQPKITFTALVVKAVVGVLKQLPKFNASLDTKSDEVVLKHFFHVGIAVDTEHGLLVPVIRDADRKSLLEIATEIEQLAAKARDRDLVQDELQHGTFTISNQGGIGGGHFTPIINWPEVAILGLGRAHAQVVMTNGVPREHLKLPLSLSYDHRAINGADAARFISLLEEALSGTFEFLVAS